MDSPALPAQLVIAARVRATEALQSALTRVRRGKEASCPHSALVPIRYDARTYILRRDAGIAHLSTVAGRLKVPFDANPHARRILAEAVGFDSADLIPRGGHPAASSAWTLGFRVPPCALTTASLERDARERR